MLNSPYIGPQFLVIEVHFLVFSNVAKNRAFRSAMSLGKTLLCLFNLRYIAFNDSIFSVLFYIFNFVNL